MWHWLEILKVFSTLTLHNKFSDKLKPFFKTGVPSFSWTYYAWKCNISIQSFPVKLQSEDILNGMYKMDLLQRTEFFH